MKVDELRIELQKRNLPADGLKAVLVVRLEEALCKDATDPPQPIDTVETTNATENLIMDNGQVEDIITSNAQQNFDNSNIDHNSVNSRKRKEIDISTSPNNAVIKTVEDKVVNEMSSVIVFTNNNQVSDWSRKIKNNIPGDVLHVYGPTTSN